MYISNENGRFRVSGSAWNAAAELLPPVLLENGAEHSLLPVREDAGNAVYAGETDRVEMTVEQVNETLFRVRRSWQNTADRKRRIQTAFRVRPCFAVEHYLIPCVNINGNPFGEGGEPKGLKRDGKKWIFSYDRVAVPACTMTENRELAVGLFASDEDAGSLQSSCSISEENGTWYQELLHPVIEAPVTYSGRDAYGPGYETWLELEPGECFSCTMYLCVSKPRWENYGICDVLDAALTLCCGSDPEVPTNREVWARSICFAKSLISEYEGKKGFIIGYLPDGAGGFAYRRDECFELAWCGQNILFCRMLVEDYIRYGHRDSLEQALEILDTRVESCTAASGLLAAQLRDYKDLNHACADTCNMGYGAYELLRVYARLREIGVDKPTYLQAAQGLCDFFCGHFSEEHGFGKLWRLDGVCLETGGTIGAFVIPALVKCYELTGAERYLTLAEAAMKFYVERDLDGFCCTAGALDTCCVDKETSAPFLMSAVLLYRLTGKPIYLEYGTKAAYYFTSWMFHYEPVYGEETEIAQYGVCVRGLTSVSAQHHHLDMYAGIVVPYLWQLAEYTGDERWRIRADMMWRAVLQYIGDGERRIHGVIRPMGSQNEALFHCRWGFETGTRGQLNDWLVAWPCAFRLSVLAELPANS